MSVRPAIACGLVAGLSMLGGCQDLILRSFADIDAVVITPDAVSVPPVEPGQMGSFPVKLEGRGVLRGMQWLPGFGSRLVVSTNEIGSYAVEPADRLSDAPSFFISYTMRGSSRDELDTAGPPDDGVLRFFFDGQATVDIFVDVDPLIDPDFVPAADPTPDPDSDAPGVSP